MVKMRTIFYSVFVVTLLGGLALSGCNKRNESMMTDFDAKKSSADKLISEINTSMDKMKADHQQWMTDLDQASAKPGADTAKINGFRNDIKKHQDDAAKITTLVDSVKMYMNAKTDNDDALKAADDRL